MELQAFEPRGAGPSRAGPGPRVWSKRGPPALKAPKIFFGHAIFLLDHALKFTGKTLLLGGHALLYTVGNTIFDEKALLISASGPAGLQTFLEKTENKEKIQNICLSGPLKAPGPLVTTLATPLLDGPAGGTQHMHIRGGKSDIFGSEYCLK